MYTLGMRWLRSPLLTLACLGLLSSQVTGLHMHMNADGYVGIPESTHVHGSALAAHDHAVERDHTDHEHPARPDHEGNRDVSIVELGAGASKLLIFLAWVGICFAIVFFPVRSVLTGTVVVPPRSRRGRWRPPLRAPPFSPIY